MTGDCHLGNKTYPATSQILFLSKLQSGMWQTRSIDNNGNHTIATKILSVIISAYLTYCTWRSMEKEEERSNEIYMHMMYIYSTYIHLHICKSKYKCFNITWCTVQCKWLRHDFSTLNWKLLSIKKIFELASLHVWKNLTMVHIRVCGPLLQNYKYDVTKKNTIQTEGIQEKAISVQKIKFPM